MASDVKKLNVIQLKSVWYLKFSNKLMSRNLGNLGVHIFFFYKSCKYHLALMYTEFLKVGNLK